MPCTNPECATGKPVFARGLCQGCYYRVRRRGVLGRKYKPGGSTGDCQANGCDRKAHAGGLCAKHYQQTVDPMRNVWKVLRSRAQGAYPVSWEDFAAFMADVGQKPGERYQLRRINVDEPWGIGNFEWREPIRVNGKTGLTTNMADYQRAWSYLRKFGLREADIQRMRAEQHEKCPVCTKALEAKHPDTGKVIRIVVDHCHRSGKVRALLHDHCNKLLGHADDDAALLRSAADYIDHHSGDGE